MIIESQLTRKLIDNILHIDYHEGRKYSQFIYYSEEVTITTKRLWGLLSPKSITFKGLYNTSTNKVSRYYEENKYDLAIKGGRLYDRNYIVIFYAVGNMVQEYKKYMEEEDLLKWIDSLNIDSLRIVRKYSKYNQ